MSWSQKHKDFGVIKVDGKKVKVHETSTSYSTITAPEEVSSANWGGDVVIVHLKSGKARRYSTTTSFTSV